MTVAHAPGVRGAVQAPDTPYKGLTPYTEADAPYFFGREVWTDILADNLKASRLTLLYGESGVGKSSVLGAGVVHRLQEQAARNVAELGLPGLAVVLFNCWRQDPVRALAAAIDGGEGGAGACDLLAGEVPDELARRNGHGGARGPLEAAIRRRAARAGGRLFLILDQFEEYFLYHAADDGPDGFAAALAAAVRAPDLRLSVLLGIREDAVARLDRFKGRIPGLFDNYLRIEHLDRGAGRDAIVKPLEHFTAVQPGAGPAYIDPELIEAVLDEVEAGKLEVGDAAGGRVGGSAGQVETPYVQLVLSRLWQEETRRGSPVMRLATLQELGDAQGIVSSHLDAAMSALAPAERNVAAGAFKYLVTRSRTKVAHSAADLGDWTGVPVPRMIAVLERLSGGDARILRPVGDGGYEIYHDVLADAVLTWRAAHEAERRVADEKAAAEAAHRRRLLRVLAVAAVVAVAVIGWLAVEALKQAARAERNEKLARAGELATRSASALGSDYDLASLLAVEAWRTADTPEARAALRRSAGVVAAKRSLPGTRDARSAAFARDGSRAVVVAPRATTLWDVAAGRAVARLGGEGGLVEQASFSGDGRRLATVDTRGAVAVWDARSGRRIAVLPAGTARGLRRVALDRHGALVGATTDARTVRLWAVPRLRVVRAALHAGGRIVRFGIAPAGGRMFLVDSTGTVRVWRPGRPRPVAVLRPLRPGIPFLARVGSPMAAQLVDERLTVDRDVTRVLVDGRIPGERPRLLAIGRRPRSIGRLPARRTVEFTADGRNLIVHRRGAASLWSARTGRPVAGLPRAAAGVSGVAFGPPRVAVVLGTDGSLVLWDAVSRHVTPVRPAARGTTRVLAFARDGRHLLASGPSGNVERWDVAALAGDVVARTDAPLSGAAFSPDGRVVVAVASDSEARLASPGGRAAARLQAARGPIPQAPFNTDGAVTKAAFDRSGARVLTVDHRGARVWDARTRRRIAAIPAGRDPMRDATFGPDGTLVATATGRTRARPGRPRRGEVALWRVSEGHAVRLFRHALPVPAMSVAFDRDGTRLVVAHGDRGAEIRDAHTGRVLAALAPRHRFRIDPFSYVPFPRAAFAPDGTRVVMVGQDGALRLWTAVGRLLRETRGSGGELFNQAAFSPDGERIAAPSDDTTVHLLDGRTGADRGALRGAGDSVSAVAFSRDGRHVAGAQANGVVRVWDRAGTELAALRGQALAVWTVAFGPDSRRILTAGQDGTARVIPCAACGEAGELARLAARHAGRRLTAAERTRFRLPRG